MNETIPSQTSRLIDLLYEDLGRELVTTRKLLQRYPDGRGAWKPHPKSRALGELATHVADLPDRGVTILERDGMDIAQRVPMVPLDSAARLLELFDGHVARLRTALGATEDAALEGSWTLRRGDAVFFVKPRRTLMRDMLINHLVHHRAQLGVYYRLLDIPIPGSYGPSADEAM